MGRSSILHILLKVRVESNLNQNFEPKNDLLHIFYKSNPIDRIPEKLTEKYNLKTFPSAYISCPDKKYKEILKSSRDIRRSQFSFLYLYFLRYPLNNDTSNCILAKSFLVRVAHVNQILLLQNGVCYCCIDSELYKGIKSKQMYICYCYGKLFMFIIHMNIFISNFSLLTIDLCCLIELFLCA